VTRFVIGPDVALRLAQDRTVVPDQHPLVAASLIRSPLLSLVFRTLDAEYVALTQLQADAFVTLDRDLPEAVRDLVSVAPVQALSEVSVPEVLE
jgi:hypothetical protein